jgi:hypothetical protein
LLDPEDEDTVDLPNVHDYLPVKTLPKTVFSTTAL